MNELHDFSPLTPKQRVQRISALFSGLTDGHGFVIRSDKNHSELLGILQKCWPASFEWHPLVDGPEEWRTMVAKRREGRSPHRRILEFMTADHRRIHQMLDHLVKLARNDQREELKAHLIYLETGLRRHFQMEEDLLFGVIIEKLGTPRGPAAVLRDQHIQSLEIVKSIGQLIRSSTLGNQLIGLAEELQQLLSSHSGMEERILYAIIDQLLDEKERDELVMRCQRV